MPGLHLPDVGRAEKVSVPSIPAGPAGLHPSLGGFVALEGLRTVPPIIIAIAFVAFGFWGEPCDGRAEPVVLEENCPVLLDEPAELGLGSGAGFSNLTIGECRGH